VTFPVTCIVAPTPDGEPAELDEEAAAAALVVEPAEKTVRVTDIVSVVRTRWESTDPVLETDWTRLSFGGSLVYEESLGGPGGIHLMAVARTSSPCISY